MSKALNTLKNLKLDMGKIYSEKFYKAQLSSMSYWENFIKEIRPLVKFRTICDFGGGVGVFCSVLNKLGYMCTNIDMSQASIHGVLTINLDLTKPISLNKKFDLVTSFETAEHLDRKYADIFIDNLVRHSDLILFSAAIPFQGGTHHVNEQPAKYWAEKFKKRGYLPVDIRYLFWDRDTNHNMLFYVKKGKLSDYPKLKKIYLNSDRRILDIIHPKQFQVYANPDELPLDFIIKVLKTLPRRAFNYYTSKIKSKMKLDK